jgi:hypothetical protein
VFKFEDAVYNQVEAIKKALELTQEVSRIGSQGFCGHRKTQGTIVSILLATILYKVS